MTGNKLAWLLGTSAIIVLGFGAQAAAQTTSAQTAGALDKSGTQLQEVVVTARKIQENLQKTPVSVSALSGLKLESAAIHDVNDLQTEVPGLMVGSAPNGSLSPLIGMRGQLTPEISTNFDQPVGIYYDGVYGGQSLGVLASDYIDVSRIEVLKGPQGTLYGRNTTAGSYNIFSNLPTDTLSGEIKAGYGNYGRAEVGGVANIPFGDGLGALRLVADVIKDNGYAENTNLGTPLNDEDTKLFRATLRLDPAPNTEIIIRADYQRSNDHGYVYDAGNLVPFGALNAELSLERFGGLTVPDLLAAQQVWNAQKNGNPFDASFPDQGYDKVEAGGVSVTASHTIGQIVLKSITAYRATDNYLASDFDPVSATTYTSEAYRPKQFTEELNATGTAIDNRLKYVAGLYYYHLSSDDAEHFLLLPALAPTTDDFANNNRDNSYAIYGQGTFAITSTINFTGGLRYTTEQKSDNVLSMLNGVCQLPAPTAGCYQLGKVSFDNVSYTAGLDWTPSELLMFYAKTSRGFLAGGLQNRPSTDPRSQKPFLPEIAYDYEVGLKSEWLDHRLRFNADVYYDKVDQLQESVIISQTGTAVENAANATIDGAEVDLTAIPIPRLLLTASLAFTDPKYDSYIDGLGNNLSWEKFQNQPKYVYSLSPQYSVPTDFGVLKAELNWYWRSKADMFPVGAAPAQYRVQDAYGLLNGRVAVDFTRQGLEIAFWARNITNKLYYSAVFDMTSSFGYSVSVPGEPRTYGVEVTKSF